jgi:transcriptional regulator with XRE-family HTH domain
MITPRQIRAARAMLDWDASVLVERTGLNRNTITNAENAHSQTRVSTLETLAQAFESEGIEFTADEGVKLRPAGIEQFIGEMRFEDFVYQVQDYLERFGGELCISVSDEQLLQQRYKNIEAYRVRMKQLVAAERVRGRILAVEGIFHKTWADLRRQPAMDHVPQASFYVFGDNLALISFEHDPSPYVVWHKRTPFAAIYLQAFNAAWDRAEIV